MKKNISFVFAAALCFLAIFALTPDFMFAASAWGVPTPPSGLPNSDLATIVMNITNYILGFVTLVAVLMLIWGGAQYLTAAGDESQVETAKNTITQAIIGLIIVGISYSVVVVIVTNFIGSV